MVNSVKSELQDELQDKSHRHLHNRILSIVNKFGNRLYFSIVTGSTVGYGDIYPKSKGAKIITSIQILTMVGLLLKS